MLVLIGLGAAAILFILDRADADDRPSAGFRVPDRAAGTTTFAPGPADAPAATTCPENSSRPELVRYWEDDLGIHVVIVIFTTCEVDQVLGDSSARFGLSLGGTSLVSGTFDLSRSPVAIPALGRSGEIELIFDADADVNPDLRARVFLPFSARDAVARGFDVRYTFVCTPSDGGVGETTVDAAGGAALDGAPSESSSGDSPTVPLSSDPTIEDAALAILEGIHRDHAGRRAAIDGQWVPQVSAKRFDGGATVDVFTGDLLVHSPSVFLDKFRAWQSRFGVDRVVLLRGSDYYSICGANQRETCTSLWIVAISEPRATPEEVYFGWCEDERLNYLDGGRITDSTQQHCEARRYGDGPPSENRFGG